MTLEQAKEKLAKYGQEHVLKYYDELSGAERESPCWNRLKRQT